MEQKALLSTTLEQDNLTVISLRETEKNVSRSGMIVHEYKGR